MEPTIGYILYAKLSNRAKIGVTRRLEKRLSTFRSHCNEDLDLVFTSTFESSKAAHKWERAMLNGYFDLRVKGEWIKVEGRFREAVENGRVGVPPRRHKVRPCCVRIPVDLLKAMDARVVEYNRDGVHGNFRDKYSRTDFLRDAITHQLDRLLVTRPQEEEQPDSYGQSLAERFASLGVTTAAQLHAQEPAVHASIIQVGDCPTEDVPRRDWVKFYREMGEMEPSEAEYAFSQATAEVKLPAGFRRQPAAKQVAWLQVNA